MASVEAPAGSTGQKESLDLAAGMDQGEGRPAVKAKAAAARQDPLDEAGMTPDDEQARKRLRVREKFRKKQVLPSIISP